MKALLEYILSLGDLILEAQVFVEQLLGVDPVLMLPVLILVFFARKAIGKGFEWAFGKQFVEDYRKSGIALVIILVSSLVVWAFSDCANVVKCALYLGPLTALVYQFFKPIVRKLIKNLPKLMLSKLGLKNGKPSQ